MTPEMWGDFPADRHPARVRLLFHEEEDSHVGHQERSFHSVVEIGSTHQHLGFVTDRL